MSQHRLMFTMVSILHISSYLHHFYAAGSSLNGNGGKCNLQPPNAERLSCTCEIQKRSHRSHGNKEIQRNWDAKVWHRLSFHLLSPCFTSPRPACGIVTMLDFSCGLGGLKAVHQLLEMDGNGISDCVDHGFPYIHLRPTLWSPLNARYLRDNFINLLSATKFHKPKSSGYSNRFECIQLQ